MAAATVSEEIKPRDACIVGAIRTPMGGLMGSLSSLSAPKLGSIAIMGALRRAGLHPSEVQEVFFGNVLSANLGQAPARQAALGAGIPTPVVCTTINKVCSSGLKAIILAAQSIQLGINDVVVAGGMESMSNAPHYIPDSRRGLRLSHGTVIDGLLKDGLWDVYNDYAMGMCAELCAEKHCITREEQDAYAIQSFKRAIAAQDAGVLALEIVPVEIPGRWGQSSTFVGKDDSLEKFDPAKLRKLRSAFKDGGSVTAGNASTIRNGFPISAPKGIKHPPIGNADILLAVPGDYAMRSDPQTMHCDGAAALVLVSGEKALKLGVPIIARIRGYGEAAQAPELFTTAPALAIPKALSNAGVEASCVDYYEINEAFSVVALANQKLLCLNPEKVNVHGGAVSLGHPIGCSGARILVTLLGVLRQKDAKFGVAAICNGGGGASALVVEYMHGAALQRSLL